MRAWTTPADIEEKVRRRWRSGDLLRAWAKDEPFPTIDVPLRGPTASELADQLSEWRLWVESLNRASHGGLSFTIQTRTVGGKRLGRTEAPDRAIISDFGQAWKLLGVRPDVQAFDTALAVADPVPQAYEWVLAHPLKALKLEPEWEAILAAREWLDQNRGSGLYLRQIDAPGVETKLIERHRRVLAELLDVTGSAAGFTPALGYAVKPALVRMRFDPELLGMPAAITEAQLRLSELAELGSGAEDIGARLQQAIIVENEISYLSLPVPRRGIVIWGEGYAADIGSSLEWLQEADTRGRVSYWGDIDTHGFAILNQVRSFLPNVKSLLMDRRILLAHRDRWGIEPTPTNIALDRLTEDESALYEDLVTDRYVARLRLEQERINWAWVEQELSSFSS